MKDLGKIIAIVWKDILAEIRSREIGGSVLLFCLLVIVIFNFALQSEDIIESAAPGILWVSFVFAGVLGLNHIFAAEKENSCLEGLMLCPVERHIIYWGKLLGSLAFMLIVEAIITPIFLALYNLPILLPRLALIIVLATLGFVSVGTLFSAMAANTRAREIMLPVLFLPIIVPVIIAAVKATGLIIDGEAWGELMSWLQLILAFDIIFLVISALVFEFVIEE
ncbi:MAG: heme exporter protein CcmB [Dehalococcoidia bacterium]